MNNTICKFCDGRGYYELTARVECGHCRGTGITPPMTQDNMKRVTVEGINRTTHHVEDNKEQLREEQKRREEAAELLASYIKQKGANYLANHEIVSMMVEFRKASAFDKKEVASVSGKSSDDFKDLDREALLATIDSVYEGAAQWEERALTAEGKLKEVASKAWDAAKRSTLINTDIDEYTGQMVCNLTKMQEGKETYLQTI